MLFGKLVKLRQPLGRYFPPFCSFVICTGYTNPTTRLVSSLACMLWHPARLSDLCPRCGCDVVMTGEDVTADERRWRHIQHAMVACCARHGPDVDELRQDVRDTCPHNCAARRTVDQAFACDLSDVHSVRQRLVPFLLDPGAGCSTMPCVRDRVMRVVAGYVLTVGAAWLEVQPDTVSASTLQLPATSRVRAYLVSIGALGGVRAGPVSAGPLALRRPRSAFRLV
jgi:hypothetical protein